MTDKNDPYGVDLLNWHHKKDDGELTPAEIKERERAFGLPEGDLSKPVYTQEMFKNGESPPVGCMALLHNDDDFDIEYGQRIIGKEVRVVSGLLASTSFLKLIAVEYGGICYCFRSSMLRPLPEPTEREKAIEEITEVICDTDECVEHRADYIVNILGYRKPTPKDAQMGIIITHTGMGRQSAADLYNALSGDCDEQDE